MNVSAIGVGGVLAIGLERPICFGHGKPFNGTVCKSFSASGACLRDRAGKRVLASRMRGSDSAIAAYMTQLYKASIENSR